MKSSWKNDEANLINDGHNWACPVGHVICHSLQSPSFIQDPFRIRRFLRRSYMLIFKFVVFSVLSVYSNESVVFSKHIRRFLKTWSMRKSFIKQPFKWQWLLLMSWKVDNTSPSDDKKGFVAIHHLMAV